MKKVVKKIIPLVAVGVMATSLVACNTAKEEQKKVVKSEKITFTDVLGNSHTFDKILDKVAIQWSGSGGAFMTMSALLGKDVYKHISGMDDGLAMYRSDMWETFTKTVPELKDIPKIGSIEKDLDVEKIISLGTEAMILPKDAREGANDAIEKLKASNIPIVYIDFHDETVKNHVLSTEIMGKMFGKEERANEIINFYKEHRQRAEDVAKKALESGKSRKLTYIETASGGPEKYGNTYTNNYLWGGIAYNSGLTSIATDKIKKGASPIDPEYILKADPEIIVLTGSHWPKVATSVRMGFNAEEESTKKLVEGYLERPGWADLKAVKEKNIHVLHHGLGREMYDCTTYEFFAKTAFPEEGKDLNPTKSLEEYYTKIFAVRIWWSMVL